VLEGSNKEVWAIEIKLSSAPKVSKGFHIASVDINATRKFVIYGGSDQYPMSNNTEVIGLYAFLNLL
jgi:predicted AAA+ superfamily ATPase